MSDEIKNFSEKLAGFGSLTDAIKQVQTAAKAMDGFKITQQPFEVPSFIREFEPPPSFDIADIEIINPVHESNELLSKQLGLIEALKNVTENLTATSNRKPDTAQI